MIDLHIHSNYSAGTDTIAEILEKANQLALSHISITDHNSVENYREVMKYRHLFKGKIIPGVEFTSYYHNELIDILAYGFNIEVLDKLIKRNILSFEQRRDKEVKMLVKHFKKLGFTIGEITYLHDQEISLKAFFRNFISFPENLNKFNESLTFKEFSRNYLFNSKSPLFVDFSKSFPSLKKLIKMIHKAGGLAFLAHPYMYHIEVVKSLDDLFAKYPLDGIECFHTTFNDRQIEALNIFAKDHHLYRSGGSDYHGQNKVNHQLKNGNGDLHISVATINEWLIPQMLI